MVLLKEEDYVRVLCLMDSYNRIIKLPSGNVIFFRGRSELLKHTEDLEFVRDNPTMFKVLSGKLPKKPEEKKTDQEPKEDVPEVKLEDLRKELEEKGKGELIDILKKLGSDKIPRLTRNKIELILKLQKPKER